MTQLSYGKFGITGTLRVGTQPISQGVPGPVIDIPQECTIEFSISRQSLTSAQAAIFTVKGLSPATRDQIFKDQFATGDVRLLQLRAGYGTFTPLVFNGIIQWAYSEKAEGAAEVSTVIHGWDGGLAQATGFTSGYGVPNVAVPKGTTADVVLKYLATNLPGTQGNPIIGTWPATNQRQEVLFGNTWDLIQLRSGGQAVIDNGQVKVLNFNEVITGPIPTIDSDSGLLGSPRRSGSIVEWDTIFEPRLTLFQAVNVVSTVNPRFNGTFKVLGFTHQGMLSPADVGRNTTTFSVYSGSGPLVGVLGDLVQ